MKTMKILPFVIVIFLVPLGLSASGAGKETKCTKSLDECVAEKRAEFQERGTIGMLIGRRESAQGGYWTVCRVVPNGPAGDAGLLAGDVVVAWNGEEISTLDEETMLPRIRSLKIGNRVTVDVQRRDEKKRVILQAIEPEPINVEYWLLTYVRENFSESELRSYQTMVAERWDQQSEQPDP